MKRSFFAFFLLLLFVFSLQAESALERLNRADSLLKEGKEREAVEIYHSLLSYVGFQRKEEYGKALYRVALLEPMATVAISLLEKYIPMVQNREYRFDCLFLLALHYDLLGESLNALNSYQKALLLYQEDPIESQKRLYWKARFFAAVLLTDLGEKEQALLFTSDLLKECEEPLLGIQATLLESRLLVEKGEVHQGVEKVISLIEKKHDNYPLLFYHWTRLLIENYPQQSSELKRLFAPLEKKASQLTFAEALPTLSIVLSQLKESSLFPVEEKESLPSVEEVDLLSANETSNQLSPTNATTSSTQKGEKPSKSDKQIDSASSVANHENQANASQSQLPTGKKYWIQVASFSDKENALYYAKELQKKDFSYKITLVKGVGYRVYVVPQEGEEISMLFLKLKDAGFEGLLVEK